MENFLIPIVGSIATFLFNLFKKGFEKNKQDFNEIKEKISTVFLSNHAKLININRNENISSDQLQSIENISSEIEKLSVELDVKNGLLPQKDWIRKILFLPSYSDVKTATDNMRIVSERVLPHYKSARGGEISLTELRTHGNEIAEIGKLLKIDTKHG